jgi:predicted nucleic acid-binding protein
VAGELLLDTGALVSLLDRSQPRHQEFADFFASWSGPVASTEAVLTEATHLLGRVPGGRQACVDFFSLGGATLVPTGQATLARCRELLEKYQNLPMDYADATLVVLAEDLNTQRIFTTDHKDFRIYRYREALPFRILPEDG